MKTINPQEHWTKLDEFTAAYIECALWSSVDFETERPLDDDFDITDIHPETFTQMVEDCKYFQESHLDVIEDNLERAGHDFWLTRNGHGAGFWDGGWPDEIGSRLTEASKAYGPMDLFVDGGKVR